MKSWESTAHVISGELLGLTGNAVLVIASGDM